MAEVLLDEAAVRSKVIELLDACDYQALDDWLIDKTLARAFDPDVVERVLTEEVHRRSHVVMRYWLGTCNCHGQMN